MGIRRLKAGLISHSIKEKKSSVINTKTLKTYSRSHSGTGLVIPNCISKITIEVNGVKYSAKNYHKENNIVFMNTVSRLLEK